MTHEDIEPACCRSRAPSPCELPSDPLLSMKQPIMADGPRCKRRKQANPRRKNALESEISTRSARCPAAACHQHGPFVTCKVCCFCP
uniref:Zinc finger E-box binding homeobox 2 n=1 Tax=Prolemur simus TaxID=1328070 RepID=A0A8C8YP31_PROSS